MAKSKSKKLRIKNSKESDISKHVGENAVVFQFKKGNFSGKCLSIPLGNSGIGRRLVIGKKKAEAILEYVEEIKEFVK